MIVINYIKVKRLRVIVRVLVRKSNGERGDVEVVIKCVLHTIIELIMIF